MNENIPDGYIRVTSVLSPYTKLDHIDPSTLANAADRGTRVHAYCEAHALGLFVDQVDADCKNYFDVFVKWFDEMVVDVFCTEKRVNSEKLRLSGAFDLVALLKGDDELSLIDIKTPANPATSWQLQTAAYKILAKEADIHVARRICLMLPKTSDHPTVIEYREHDRDEKLFLNALELYRFFK